MILIWSGWGFLVLVFFIVGGLIGIPVANLFSQSESITAGIAVIIGGLIAGLGSFLLARKIESGGGRAFIDEETGQRIVVRRNAGSLFFVPTRYWAYVAPLLGIALGAILMTSPVSDSGVASASQSPVSQSAAAPEI